MMGNHWTLCTFTAQEIGRWVVTHSKADSSLHGYCFAIFRKQCRLWFLFVNHHLNPSSALSDHRESVAVTAHIFLYIATSWVLSGQATSWAHSTQGKMPMPPEGCHHLPTRSCHSRLRLATATNKDMKAFVMFV